MIIYTVGITGTIQDNNLRTHYYNNSAHTSTTQHIRNNA